MTDPTRHTTLSLDESITRHTHDGIRALEEQLARDAPFLAIKARDWMSARAGGRELTTYFLDPKAFPLVRLTHWFTAAEQLPSDDVFEAAVARSNLCGAYYVRLVDNVMDDNRPRERVLLPLLHVLHLGFTQPYTELFPPAHPFWRDFERIWARMAEVTLLDALCEDFDRSRFEAISAVKSVAAEIPLTAAAYHYERTGQLSAWLSFVEVLGRFYQMLNDVRDWCGDRVAGAPTWLNSEARRRSGSSLRDMTAFMHDEGLAWASDVLHGWVTQLTAGARTLGSEPAAAYVTQRWEIFEQDAAKLRASLGPAVRLLEAFQA
jgi:hypothetical protein